MVQADTSQFTGAQAEVPAGQSVVPATKAKQLVSLSCLHGPEVGPQQPVHMPLPGLPAAPPSAPKVARVLVLQSVLPAGQLVVPAL